MRIGKNYNLRQFGFWIMALAFVFIAESCKDKVTDILKVPVVSFTFVADADDPFMIKFSNTSTNGESFAWDFGDSKGTSTEKEPTYKYEAAGTYTVKLTVTSETGTSADLSKDVKVEEKEEDPVELKASFTYVVDETDNKKVTFTSTSTGAKSYSWDFGDESEANTDENPVYTYAAYGSYDVKLTVTGMDDATDEATMTVEIQGEDPVLKASFTHEVDATDNKKVTFTSTSTGAKSYSWDFGDSKGTNTEENPVYTYATYGSYDVKLTVTGMDGATNDTTMTVGIFTYEKVGDVAIDFESSNPKFEGFAEKDGTITASIVDNPVSGGINTSDKVGKVVQTPGVELWAGFFFVLSEKIDFSTNRTIKLKVYSPAEGETVLVKLEDKSDGDVKKEIKGITTVKDTWEELSFVFAKEDNGKFDKLVLFFNFEGDKTAETTHYFDDIVLAEDDAQTQTPKASFTYVVDETDNRKVTFTSTSTGAKSYSWDFGDQSEANTEENPVHTYATYGSYDVKLTVTGMDDATDDETQKVLLTDPNSNLGTFTMANFADDNIKWKIESKAGSIRGGIGLDGFEWWSFPADDLTVRACFLDDTFIFKTDGSLTIDRGGSTYFENWRSEGKDWSCADPATDAHEKFQSLASGEFNFEVSEADSDNPATLKVVGKGAYLGLAKAFNGGELSDGSSDVQDNITYDVISYTPKTGSNPGSLKIAITVNTADNGIWKFDFVTTD